MIALLAFAAARALAPPAAVEQEAISPAIRLRYEICYALAAAPAYPDDVARCFGFARAQDLRFTEHVCGFLRDTDQLNDFGFTTYAVCVRDLLAT